MRFLQLIGILLLTGSCSIIATRPDKLSFEDRLATFPTANLPLNSPVSVHWNQYLVPFVEAETDEDCAFVLGLIHAHLRLGQMEFYRMASQGKLSEGLGPFTVDIDRSIRMMELDRAVDQIEMNLPDDTRQWLTDFLRGINWYVAQMKEVPEDFRILNRKPTPWSMRDLLTAARLLSVDVSWFNFFRLSNYTDKPWWNDFFERWVKLGAGGTPSATPDMFSMINNTAGRGSNAFAVSPGKTTDGAAVLASDPHLGLMLPNIWLIAGYRCPSYHVTGLMFPGIPIVMVGRNEHISWGSTNMRSASSDFFRLDEEERKAITTYEEDIVTRWWFDRKVRVRTTPWGPVVSDIPLLGFDENDAIVLRWVGHEPSDEVSAFLGANRAKNWEEFRNAFADYAVSGQNVVYADREGHIGLLPAVMIPDRGFATPEKLLLEHPATAWKRLVKTSELPVVFDPPDGFIASANNKPFDYDPPLGWFFSADDRMVRFRQLLSTNRGLDLTDIMAIQQDVHVPSALRLRDVMLPLLSPENDDQRQMLEALKAWDGFYTVDSQGAVAYQTLCHAFILPYYEMRYDEDAVGLFLSTDWANVLMMQDLMDDPKAVEVLNESFRDATDDWDPELKWGDIHRYQPMNPFSYIPGFGARWRFDDLPISGSYNTISKSAHQISGENHTTFYGANARFITRLDGSGDSWLCLLGGQDGRMGSPSIIDQIPLWTEGQYIRVPLKPDKDSFPVQWRLTP